MTNYYQLLEIEEYAVFSVIKSAYRRLSLIFHPDRNPGNAKAEEKMKAINEAYEVLSDEEKREQYNTRLAGWKRQQEEPFEKRQSNPQSESNLSNWVVWAAVTGAIILLVAIVLGSRTKKSPSG